VLVALAIALGNLYHDDTRVDEEDVAGVMAAAYHMQCAGLLNGSVQQILRGEKYRFFKIHPSFGI